MSVPAKSFIAATLCRTAQPHVLGVPVRPVRVALPNALLVLAVSGLRTSKRARQVACGAKGSSARFDATWVPYHDLLQVPAVAVGITEQGARAVGETIGMQAAAPAFRAIVEELADLDAGGDQVVPGGLDVGNDQDRERRA